MKTLILHYHKYVLINKQNVLSFEYIFDFCKTFTFISHYIYFLIIIRKNIMYCNCNAR